jgi:hypothetical protein
MDGLEPLAAGLIEDAHGIDAGAGTFEGALDRAFIPQIRLNHLDLADITQQTHAMRQVGLTNGDPDPQALTRQGANNLASEKAGTAENRDQILHGVRLKLKGLMHVRIDDAEVRRNATCICVSRPVDPGKALP